MENRATKLSNEFNMNEINKAVQASFLIGGCSLGMIFAKSQMARFKRNGVINEYLISATPFGISFNVVLSPPISVINVSCSFEMELVDEFEG